MLESPQLVAVLQMESEGQRRGGESAPLTCCPAAGFFRYSPGYNWLSGLSVHTASSCPAFHPPVPPKSSWQGCFPSLQPPACIDTRAFPDSGSASCTWPRWTCWTLLNLNKVPVVPLLDCPLPLDGIPSLRCVNPTTQLGVICRSAIGALNPTICVIPKVLSSTGPEIFSLYTLFACSSSAPLLCSYLIPLLCCAESDAMPWGSRMRNAIRDYIVKDTRLQVN